MAENSSNNKVMVDIKPTVNSESSENKGDLNGTSKQNTTMKQESTPVVKDLALNITESSNTSHNGTDKKPPGVIDLTRPLKTEGEASSSSDGTNVSRIQLTTTPTGVTTPDVQTLSTFGGISGLPSHLSPEEQSAAYKRANILALSALAKNGGPNAKEMLAKQQKLQEFLTSLISLAGQKGPEVKVKVQQLVHNLVTGQVPEEDFATQIEVDLQSQHQPSLLPFLKDSVPHLKVRLQLQQAIMKELLQRQEKDTTAPSTTPQSTNASHVTLTTQSHAAAPSGIVPKPIVIGAGTIKNSTGGPTRSSLPANQVGSTPPPNFVLPPALIDQLSKQLPQNVRDKIAKLPSDQQKLVYHHHFKNLQILLQKQKASTAAASSEQAVQNAQEQLIKEQQVPLTLNRGLTPKTTATASRPSFSNMKFVSSASPSGTPPKVKKTKVKGKDVSMDNEDEDEAMDILDEAGVNLQEESAQFLPQTEGIAGSVKDQPFLDVANLRRRVSSIARQHGVGEVSEDCLTLLSHATEGRLRDILEKLTQISQHRTEVLKDNSQYRVQSEVRGQLRVLETIDRLIDKRKSDREYEQTLKAAKSRSSKADPEIKEVARQIQEDKAAIMRDQAANETALKAIGSRRKRPSPQSDGTSSGSGTSQLFAPLNMSRAPKRHVTSRDLVFYLEQERETRKSLTLYKALMK